MMLSLSASGTLAEITESDSGRATPIVRLMEDICKCVRRASFKEYLAGIEGDRE